MTLGFGYFSVWLLIKRTGVFIVLSLIGIFPYTILRWLEPDLPIYRLNEFTGRLERSSNIWNGESLFYYIPEIIVGLSVLFFLFCRYYDVIERLLAWRLMGTRPKKGAIAATNPQSVSEDKVEVDKDGDEILYTADGYNVLQKGKRGKIEAYAPSGQLIGIYDKLETAQKAVQILLRQEPASNVNALRHGASYILVHIALADEDDLTNVERDKIKEALTKILRKNEKKDPSVEEIESMIVIALHTHRQNNGSTANKQFDDWVYQLRTIHFFAPGEMHNIGKLLIQQAEIVANCDGMATDDQINAIQRLKLQFFPPLPNQLPASHLSPRPGHSGINPLVGTRTMLNAISYIFTLTALWDDLVVSEDESKLVRRKLQVWDPELSEDQLKELGEVSLLSYQRDVLTGDSTEYLRAMNILRKRLTPEQVANLQNDLEEIARIKSIQEGQANYLLMVNNFFAEKSFVQKVGQKFGFNLV